VKSIFLKKRFKMNFDKFMKDIEKKQEPKRVYTKEEIEYHNMIMKRNFSERELWQNRIKWSR
tara:strand:+ start:460 stop:645 length:186 start_codon:yes stop_codon:yes gene_type:complete